MMSLRKSCGRKTTDKMKKLSVIIPVYNVEKYLSRCLESVVSQTFKDLQIILVDDGSRDASGQMCDAWAERDDRIMVIHKENGGLSSARNAGLAKAQGEWVAFLDSDDWLEPCTYEYLIERIVKHQLDIAACATVLKDNTRHEPLLYEKKYADRVIEGDETSKLYFSEAMHYGLLNIVVWNKVYRRAWLEDIDFPESVNREDNYFSGLVMAKKPRCMYINYPGHYYFSNYSGIMASNKQPLDLVLSLSMLKQELEHRNLSNSLVTKRVNMWISKAIYHYIRDAKAGCRVVGIRKELVKYLCKNLSARRVVVLFWLLYKRGISII